MEYTDVPPKNTESKPSMTSRVPTYNEECLQMAQGLSNKHPELQSGFENIDAFVNALDDDPELKSNGQVIRDLTTKIKRSSGNKNETNIRIYAEYASYVKVADAVYKSYSAFLKRHGLEFLAENKATSTLPVEDVKFVTEIRTILWNYTDANLQFCERVCNSGILKYFVGDLKTVLEEAEYPINVSLNDQFFRSARGVLHNCSNNPITRQTIRELGTVSVALAFLEGSTTVKMLILLLLANIIDEKDNKLLIADDSIFTVILKMIESALRKPEHRFEGLSVAELMVGLTGLAKNDKNKKLLTEKGAIPVVMTIMKGGSDDERLRAVQCVWELAFDKENQKTFLTDTDLINILEEQKQSSNTDLFKAAEGALWAINLKKKEEREQKKRSIQDNVGHVMMSYEWADQEEITKLTEYLRSQKFTVWMDIDNMEDSILDAMAKAVENSAVVLVCVSERYKNSQNCRLEAEYACILRKSIIPLIMQRDYKPDGWLGLIKGAKLYYDFSGKYTFNKKAADLAKALGYRGKSSPSNDITVVGPSGPGSRSMVDWSRKEVHNWLSKLGLEKQSTLKSLTGKQLAFLSKLSRKAPAFFYGYLKADLQLTNLEDLMNFSEAVETL